MRRWVGGSPGRGPLPQHPYDCTNARRDRSTNQVPAVGPDRRRIHDAKMDSGSAPLPWHLNGPKMAPDNLAPTPTKVPSPPRPSPNTNAKTRLWQEALTRGGRALATARTARGIHQGAITAPRGFHTSPGSQQCGPQQQQTSCLTSISTTTSSINISIHPPPDVRIDGCQQWKQWRIEGEM